MGEKNLMNLTNIISLGFILMILTPAIIVISTLNLGKVRGVRVEEKRILSLSIVGGISVFLGLVALMYFMGTNMYTVMEENLDSFIKYALSNKTLLYPLDLQNASDAFATATIKGLFKEFAVLFPAIVIFWIGIISVIEYNVIRSLLFKKYQGQYTLREFRFDFPQFIKFAVIYIVPRIIGEIYKNEIILNIAININAIIRLLMILEGAAYIINALELRSRKKRIYQQIIAIVLLILPYGSQGLFILGMFSIGFRMRDRIARDLLKK